MTSSVAFTSGVFVLGWGEEAQDVTEQSGLDTTRRKEFAMVLVVFTVGSRHDVGGLNGAVLVFEEVVLVVGGDWLREHFWVLGADFVSCVFAILTGKGCPKFDSRRRFRDNLKNGKISYQPPYCTLLTIDSFQNIRSHMSTIVYIVQSAEFSKIFENESRFANYVSIPVFACGCFLSDSVSGLGLELELGLRDGLHHLQSLPKEMVVRLCFAELPAYRLHIRVLLVQLLSLGLHLGAQIGHLVFEAMVF
jgi:hypothetical protein